MGSSPGLEVSGLTVAFGGLVVVEDVSFSVGAGERLGVIGPNGAGKTTLMNCLSGLVRARLGTIRLDGADISVLPGWRRARLGMARSFQLVNVVAPLTVLGNMMLAVDAAGAGRGRSRGRKGASFFGRRELVQHSTDTLERFGLLEDANRPASELPYGSQRLLDLGMALAGSPKVALLDEPSAGIASRDLEAVLNAIRGWTDGSLIVVDHDIDFVYEAADRVMFLDKGRKLVEGSPREVAGDPRVREAYFGLGGEEDA
jgi:branched-chain amino acid transport system ATP-binding protein